jgi:hypothetical protein
VPRRRHAQSPPGLAPHQKIPQLGNRRHPSGRLRLAFSGRLCVQPRARASVSLRSAIDRRRGRSCGGELFAHGETWRRKTSFRVAELNTSDEQICEAACTAGHGSSSSAPSRAVFRFENRACRPVRKSRRWTKTNPQPGGLFVRKVLRVVCNTPRGRSEHHNGQAHCSIWNRSVFTRSRCLRKQRQQVSGGAHSEESH